MRDSEIDREFDCCSEIRQKVGCQRDMATGHNLNEGDTADLASMPNNVHECS